MQTTANRDHPRPVPIQSQDCDPAPDTPFAVGTESEIDADLRHRLISDAAYARYCKRGYADGYDVEDWLDAEAEVDHLLLNRA